MSSTQENEPQAVAKGGSGKPPGGSPVAKADPTRHVIEPRPAGSGRPLASDPLPSSHPLRWLLMVLLLGGGAAGGTYWYQTHQRVIDQRHLVLQGNIDVRQVNLAFKVEGRIATLEVDEGDKVKAGEKLATLDEQYFQDDLRLVTARRDSAKATLEKLEHGSRDEEIAGSRAQVEERTASLRRAQQDFKRAEGLIKTHAISDENFDSMKAALQEADARLKYAEKERQMVEIGPRVEDIAAARAQLQAEEVAVTQSERRLRDSVLIAPSDGIVLTRAREKGAIVAPGETIFALTLATPVWVRTYVNEMDLGRIRPGMKAEVRTDSAPDKVYEGRIGFISPASEFTPKTVETRELRTDLVYRLRVIVDHPDAGLRQGMPVTVTLDVAPKD
jgi:membrane fusion protein YbhG